MKNYGKPFGALAAASALAAGQAFAGDAPTTTTVTKTVTHDCECESPINYNLHAGYTSEYVFRGVNLGRDLVEAGVDITGKYKGLELAGGAWYGSYDIAGVGVSVSELDLYGSVAYDFDFAKATVGYIWYDQRQLLNQVIGDAQEVYFSLSKDFFKDTAWSFNTALTYYWDIELENDGYSTLAITKSFELSKRASLIFGSTLAYLVEESRLAHLTSKVSLEYKVAKHAKFTPFVALSLDLNGGQTPAYSSASAFGPAKNQLVGGAMLSVDF